MKESESFYPLSTTMESIQSNCVMNGITIKEKLAHDYLCASITSGVAWTSDELLIESVFNLADKFIKYANNNLSNK